MDKASRNRMHPSLKHLIWGMQCLARTFPYSCSQSCSSIPWNVGVCFVFRERFGFLYFYIYIHTYTHTHIHTLEENKHTKAEKTITTTLLPKYGTLEEFHQTRYTHSKTFNIMPHGLSSLLMVNLVPGWWRTPYQQLTNHIFFGNKPVMHQLLYFLPNYNTPSELHPDF